jgi:hypothetical protein
VRNNLYNDISLANWGPLAHGWQFEISIESSPLLPLHDVTIDHNTGFLDQMFLEIDQAAPVTSSNFQFTNNISDYGQYGLFASQGSGSAALSNNFSNYTYSDVVILNPAGSVGGYPSGTYWSTLTGVGFTSISGTDPNNTGNFQLTSSSPYYQAGTDGKDIGVWDWTCLNNDSAAALAGKFVPSAGCALSGNLLPQPPTNLTVTVQ